MDEVRTKKLAVIITTHYIDEAKQATKIGMMRNGVLLAEDSPSNILSMYRTEKLEDAFLQMCLEQQTNLKERKYFFIFLLNEICAKKMFSRKTNYKSY